MKTVMIRHRNEDSIDHDSGGIGIYDLVLDGKDTVVIRVPHQHAKLFAAQLDLAGGSGFDYVLAEVSKSVLLPDDTLVRDHTKNPKLQALYVDYAMETMDVVYEALDQLNSHSRVDSSLLAGALHEEMTENIRFDSAWREAAWRRAANMPSPHREPDDIA